MIEFTQGCYYHVFNRGFGRIPVFQNEANYLYALRLIQKYFAKYFITTIAYCLMPNHYHFLLRQESDCSIGNAIRDIFNAYVQGLNRQVQRQGAMFQGRFKAILIDNEPYLIHLCRYIHRNPIDGKTPLVGRLAYWAYSNYPEWIGKRNGKLVDRKFVREYFSNGAEYESFAMETPSVKALLRMEKYLLD
jgi:REP element-mobilizing transposase RayT